MMADIYAHNKKNKEIDKSKMLSHLACTYAKIIANN
jgi:hypothetical protein